MRLLRIARLRILASLLAALAASGCVQMQPQVLLTPDTRDGRQIYTVKCGSSAYSIGSCYEQARTLCGANGFDILDHKESPDRIWAMNISCRP